MTLHYNDNFIYINGRPVGHTDDVNKAELEACGFVRITKDFNENSFDVVNAADVKAEGRKTAPKAAGKDGPVLV